MKIADLSAIDEDRTGIAYQVEEPMIDPNVKKAVRASKKAPVAAVRTVVKKLSPRGHKPILQRSDLDETIRRHIPGTLNATYMITDDDDGVIGQAKVADGVIEDFTYLTSAKQGYRGQITAALLDMIVTEADARRANLSIQIVDITNEIKSIFERFGFFYHLDDIMKRAYGSIRPPGVSPPQGMSNLPYE